MSRDFQWQYDVLKSGDAARLEELAELIPDFPHGTDDFIHRNWIINAIDSGSLASVKWMIERRVNLNFRDLEGYTPLHTALEQAVPLRYELLEMLISAGAPINLKGGNDWTPAHAAAARDDVRALEILVKHGADLTIRTSIDDYATPLEEARTLGASKAVEFLEGAV
jgi:ankyrin repeat protein